MENELIVKSNNLIEARYKLSLNEQKIILYAVSKLDKNLKKFNTLTFDVREFFGLIGTTQERYTEIREIIRELRKKEIRINTENRELITGWLSSMDYLKNEGTIELEFSKKLIPYLLQLKERFTRYQLKNILYLQNKHSIRVYELLKQYENIGYRKISIKTLKECLGIDENEYTRFSNFENRVLKTTKHEINEYTDLFIDYEKIKTGRFITDINFKIKSKDQDEKVYIEFLNDYYDIKTMQEKMGLGNLKLSAEQVIELYDIAVEKTSHNNLNPFSYIEINYIYIKNKARNIFAYLKKALKEDLGRAILQLKTGYICHEN